MSTENLSLEEIQAKIKLLKEDEKLLQQSSCINYLNNQLEEICFKDVEFDCDGNICIKLKSNEDDIPFSTPGRLFNKADIPFLIRILERAVVLFDIEED